ncbi:MAG: anti-sigma factor [Dehalococcoidia bacterium]
MSNDLDCARAREELGAYVLDALDQAETRLVEQHLWTCDACRDELGALEEAAGAIALTTPLKRAPVELRSRVLQAIEAPGAPGSPVTSGPPPALEPRRGWRWVGFAGAAAAALLFAATLGWAISLQMQVGDLQDEQDLIVAQHDSAQEQIASLADASAELEAHEAALYLLSDQTARYAPLQGQGAASGADALYVWSPGERLGIFLSQDLDKPPDGMTYHLWLQMENGSIDGGTFWPDADGTAEVIVKGSDATPAAGQSRGPLQAVVVTLEPTSGAGEEPDVVMSGAPTAE